MPDAPAPTPDLSRTPMSAPLPAPRASSSLARCQAVERPCMPAPMMTYGVWAGVLTAHLLPTARVPAGLQVGGILPVALGDARVAAEERALRRLRSVPGPSGHPPPPPPPPPPLVHAPPAPAAPRPPPP